jgi:hypothetical protein
MTREMTERYMNLLDEHHQKNAFVQLDGSVICRSCHEAWPCDMRQVLDAFADLGNLLNVVGALHMKGYGLVSALVEALEQDEKHLAVLEPELEVAEEVTALLTDAKAYLEVGVSQ